jgi:hypothetical protein
MYSANTHAITPLTMNGLSKVRKESSSSRLSPLSVWGAGRRGGGTLIVIGLKMWSNGPGSYSMVSNPGVNLHLASTGVHYSSVIILESNTLTKLVKTAVGDGFQSVWSNTPMHKWIEWGEGEKGGEDHVGQWDLSS